jgi:hypothetical protein
MSPNTSSALTGVETAVTVAPLLLCREGEAGKPGPGLEGPAVDLIRRAYSVSCSAIFLKTSYGRIEAQAR